MKGDPNLRPEGCNPDTGSDYDFHMNELGGLDLYDKDDWFAPFRNSAIALDAGPVVFVPLSLPQDRDELAAWLSAESWPFHVNRQLTPEQVGKRIDAGGFSGPDSRCFWMMGESGDRLGFLHLFDLEDVDDGSPMFDLKIKAAHRGKGLGKAALRWLTAYLFETYPTLNRVEGNTRIDNVAMRRTFLACGYAKEGHFRDGWPTEDGGRVDTVHYGILRKDWETGKTSPVDWES